MSYNGSGTFVVNSTGQPVVTGTVISSTAFNALTADLATGLSTAITKDGQTTTTVRVPFAAGISSTLVTDATSATTGSIITAGGISTQKALWVGTTSRLVGAVTADAGVSSTLTTDATSATTGSIVTAGGISMQKALWVGTTSRLVGAVTMNAALTYGGVTLSNAVTGTGNMVLGTNPVFPSNALINATLQSWSALWPALQIGLSAAFWSGTASRFTAMSSDLYYDGTNYRYINGGAGQGATMLGTNGETFDFYRAVSGGSAGGVASPNVVCTVAGNGNLTNTNGSYGTISDIKTKIPESVKPAASTWAKVKLLASGMVTYERQDNPGFVMLGNIAQEVQKISPGLVVEDADTNPATGKPTGTVTLSIKTTIQLLMGFKALGEALERIETLEARLTALETV